MRLAAKERKEREKFRAPALLCDPCEPSRLNYFLIGTARVASFRPRVNSAGLRVSSFR
jgi:hypothetical protein